MTGNTPPLEFDALIAEARARAELHDFGADWFFEPLRQMLAATHRDARLHEIGKAIEAERIVTCLVNRLHTIEMIRQHPEILEEEVEVAGAIANISRSGSTMTHRMLCTAPEFTGLSWWEAQFPCPFPGEERGRPVARRAEAQRLMDLWLSAMPDIMSIHPMSLDQPDEEAILLDQVFIGTMVECFLWVPSYAQWLETADQRTAYQELKTQLKFLQWQDSSRRGKAWILKTPQHLSAPEALLETFPGSVIIMTHRDPVRTIPSYCSLNATLMGMKSDQVPLQELGPFISRRWSWMLNNVIALRDRIGDARFIDVQYDDLVRQPLVEARRIFAAMRRPYTEADEAAFRAWLDVNKRDNRPPHRYELATFGLTEELLKRDFAAYRARYILPATG